MRLCLLSRVGLLLCFVWSAGCASDETPEQSTEKAVSTDALSVFVVRHAEAWSNLPQPVDAPDGELDALTPRGMEQARAAGRFLMNKDVVAVVSSPRGRARQTAQAIAAAIGLSDPPDVDHAFAPLKEGEPLEHGMDRAALAVEEQAGKYPGRAVVVVTHSDIGAALIGKAEGTAYAECYNKHKPALGSISEISVSERGWTLKSQSVVPAP